MHSANLSSRKQIYFFPEDPLPQGEIFLVGTVHRVPGLAPWLKKLLLKLKPALISVEISPLSWRYRKSREKLWLKRLEDLLLALPPSLRETPGIKLFQETLRLPYEVRIAEEVARLLGVSWVPLDLNCFAKPYLDELENLLSPEGLKALALSPVNPPEKEMALARLVLQNGLSLPEDQERERRLIRRLRLIAGPKPLVHIGGWRHLPTFLKHFPEARGIFLFQKDLGGAD